MALAGECEAMAMDDGFFVVKRDRQPGDLYVSNVYTAWPSLFEVVKWTSGPPISLFPLCTDDVHSYNCVSNIRLEMRVYCLYVCVCVRAYVLEVHREVISVDECHQDYKVHYVTIE